MKSIILHDFEVRNALKNDVIQIRRPVKNIPECVILDMKRESKLRDPNLTKWLLKMCKCHFGQPRDWLWVKETWLKADDGYHYKSDASVISEGIRKAYGYKWHSSVHMSGWASRITLEVEDVRVEPVQNITEDDAKAEGFEDGCGPLGDGKFDDVLEREWTARDEFCDVWDSLYAKKGFGWDDNLPVWVGRFKVVERK